jgi:RimJ/RimL family protein N-acetyltransferase
MSSNLNDQGKKVWFGDSLDITFRLIRHDDAALLKEFFLSHSKQTVLHRYFAPLNELTVAQIGKFVDLDFKNDTAIVGLVPFHGRERMLCVGRYFRDPATNSAEIAITVHDDFQGQGIGTFLLRNLIRIARAHGIEELTADVLVDNPAMMRLLHRCSDELEISVDAGVYHVIFPVGKRMFVNAKSLTKIGRKEPAAQAIGAL